MSQPRVFRAGEWNRIAPEDAGWSYVGFEVRTFDDGESLTISADDHERAFVPLSGTVTAVIDGKETVFGGRKTVFDGLGHTLYVPRDTEVTLTATPGAELAIASAPATERHEVRLVTPDDLGVESRGGGNATRQVATPMPPGFPADRLLVVEVWTPGGNWSSFPPHKHEVDRDGEAALEETYYYRLRDPENGWAIQRAYSPEREFDLVEVVRDGDICTLPWAYHTTVAAHGHDLYYLNVLAGPAAVRTLQAFQDPCLAELQDAWSDAPTDERVPFVPRYPA
ncbi:5-deoxy-glucuronate isomerase [Microbacterium esteraromaticum]|uniref:5-deoxy-glucuronate isomerase n=1 Tax=Microbacterium esteraromaticum TaxID=57043 RepID=A0A1R4K0J5_9MICO|nr:5-deoxy-glucuronate isomerase [Microbacterium esteraromaticum]SJN37806.1 5-deoxy-glucuronate isomerase [Microbacterium esteraromaticum]